MAKKRLRVEAHTLAPDRISRVPRTVYVYGNVQQETDDRGRTRITPTPNARTLSSTYGLKRAARKAVQNEDDPVILAVLLRNYTGGGQYRWLSIKTTRYDIDFARKMFPGNFREQVAEIFQFLGRETPGDIVAWQATKPQP